MLDLLPPTITTGPPITESRHHCIPQLYKTLPNSRPPRSFLLPPTNSPTTLRWTLLRLQPATAILQTNPTAVRTWKPGTGPSPAAHALHPPNLLKPVTGVIDPPVHLDITSVSPYPLLAHRIGGWMAFILLQEGAAAREASKYPAIARHLYGRMRLQHPRPTIPDRQERRKQRLLRRQRTGSPMRTAPRGIREGIRRGVFL